MFERGRDSIPPSFLRTRFTCTGQGAGCNVKHDAVHRHEAPAGASGSGLRIGDERCTSYNFPMYQSLSGAAA